MNDRTSRIEIGHSMDGRTVGIKSEGHVLTWPTELIPAIVAALHACASGGPILPDCKGMVVRANGRFLLINKRGGFISFDTSDARYLADDLMRVGYESAMGARRPRS